MANLNLSQFGEKLFVADADHTFIWDTAASISKRVSRNSWLNSGTLTSDAPVTISQTWNQIGTAFTAFKVNAVSTASASGSLLLDLQVGGASKFKVDKDGAITTQAIFALNTSLQFIFAGNRSVMLGIGDLRVSGGSTIGWSSNGTHADGGPPDTILLRDGAANTLALRNGAAAQTFNVYGTSSASNANYARLALTCGLDGNATISTQALGTGTAGTVSINGIVASSTGTSLTFAGANGIILSQSNYINLQSNAYAAVQALGARGAGNEPSSIACIYGPNSGTIDATSAFKIYRRTGGVDSVPFMVNSAGNVGIGTTSPTSKLQVYLNPANNYTTETVSFGNIHFANGTGGYSNLWMGSISTPLTLSASNYTLANDGTNTIINGGSGGLFFHVGASAHWNIQSTGHLLCASDNSRDIGAVNSQRPRNIYVGSDVISRPSASITPANNGQLVVEATSNTTLTFKLKGTDGTVRTGTITLA